MIVKSDLHMHTNFDDGKNTISEMVESAIEKGFETVGISGHSFTPFDLSYCVKKQAQYLHEIAKAKRKYADKIDLLCGVEADFYSDINKADYDYVIGSVHYFKSVKNKYYPIDESKQQFWNILRLMFDNNREHMVSTYYNNVVAMVKKQRPDIIGHFDLITKFGGDNNTCELPEEKYLPIVQSAIDEIINIQSYSPVFEINTGAISRGYKNKPYPSINVLKLLRGKNAPVILSSDAHNRDSIGYFFDESIAILKEIGYNTVVLASKTGFISKGI
jgi:histidinol-phosphatase (PHP family)